MPTQAVAVNGKTEHSASMSLQERDFSNPIYTRDIETEDHYTLPDSFDTKANSEDFYATIASTEDIYAIPDSPPCNIYERVADYSSREDAAGSSDTDMYSVVNT